MADTSADTTTAAPGDTMADTSADTTTAAPGDTMADTSADTTTAAPGDTMADTSADTTTAAPGDAMADTTADTTTAAPGDTMADTSADTTTAAPGDTMADTSADTTTAAPGDTMADTSADTTTAAPGDTMADTSADTTTAAPGDAMADTSADTTTAAPGDTMADTSADTTTAAPGDTMADTSADTTTAAPGDAMADTTADTTTAAPGDTMADTSADTTTAAPGDHDRNYRKHGNLWRFPYLCGKFGGAAFMISYLIMLVFAGFPVFYMELALGQFAQLCPVMLYQRMSPLFTGLGACQIMAEVYTAVYYNVIIAWALHYMANSFRSPLLWSHCTNDYNTFRCFDDILFDHCESRNRTYYRGQCLDQGEVRNISFEIEQHWNISIHENYRTYPSYMDQHRVNFAKLVSRKGLDETGRLQLQIEDMLNLTGRWSPTKEYLHFRMLNISEGIEPEHYGGPLWQHVVCLFFAWLLMFVCLLGGTKTSGKVVYFTATFPYIIMIILLGRGLTLGEGVVDGLRFFVIPKTALLNEGKTWGAAATQIFFSLSLGGGGLTTIASYNKFHNNLFRDTLIVVLGNCGTSILAGLVIFPVVGYIAAVLKRPVWDVAKSGVGMAFVVYPHAINRMAVPQLWAFLFFFMLVLLGVDSQLVLVEIPLTALLDTHPVLRSKWRKVGTVGAACLLGFLLGIVFTAPGGPYLLSLMDNYAAGWPIVITCIIELVMVMYVYGVRNFVEDINMMLGKPPNMYYKILGYPVNLYWVANWMLISPGLLITVVIFNFITYQRSTYDSYYTYPVWADVVGWMITLSCVIMVPAFAIYKIVDAHRKGIPILSLLEPTPDWGPGDKSVIDGKGRYTPHNRANGSDDPGVYSVHQKYPMNKYANSIVY